jgi:hypothetical protein
VVQATSGPTKTSPVFKASLQCHVTKPVTFDRFVDVV